MKEFFKLTKTKTIYLVAIGLVIIVSGILAQRVIYCIRTPCPQFTSTIIGQVIYSVLTFNRLFVNTGFAVKFKNLLEPVFSASVSYLIFSFVISLILHYILISLIIIVYYYFKRKRRKWQNKAK